MSEVLQKALDAITKAQPKDEGPVWMVGEQLKDILRTTLGDGPAQVVNEDFTAQKTPLADCEAKIRSYAKKHGGCCTPKAADKIIREHFGLPAAGEASAAEPTADAAPVALDLDSFL